MRVKASQLIPGCILLKDVKGKTNRPIIPKDTVLTELHLDVLNKFLVDEVDVASKLEGGKPFEPQAVGAEEEAVKQESKANEVEEQQIPFRQAFVLAVSHYEAEQLKWQNSMPIDIPAVRKLIMPLLENVENLTPEELYTLTDYIDPKGYLYRHSVAVAVLAAYTAQKMGLSKGESLQAGLAGLLMNCGMAKLDPDIMLSKDPLTDMESVEIQKHPTYSYRMIEQLPALTQGVKIAVLQHHERNDGSGYPLKVKHEKIHLYARILAVCDTYHAMTSERPYKQKQSPFKAMEEIIKGKYVKFDPLVVDTFINHITNLSVGSKVKLSSGQDGEVVYIDSSEPTRPMVRLDGSREIITLGNQPDIYIMELEKS